MKTLADAYKMAYERLRDFLAELGIAAEAEQEEPEQPEEEHE